MIPGSRCDPVGRSQAGAIGVEVHFLARRCMVLPGCGIRGHFYAKQFGLGELRI